MHFPSHAPFAAEAPLARKKDILQVLLEGHEQIRSSTALAVQLGHAQDASLEELSKIASRLTRYFTLGLPQHIEDEDYTLLPSLFTTTLSPEELQLLWELGHQHEELEQLVERLMPAWATVRDTPQRYPELAEPLARGGRQLLMQMEEHLHLEEQMLFPLIRSRFSQATLLRLATDLANRRRQLA